MRLDDEATPPEAASVVRVTGAVQVPPRYHGDTTLIDLGRGSDSYFGDRRFEQSYSKLESGLLRDRRPAFRPRANSRCGSGS
ncbi:hypothetical protein ATM97_20990 [Nocardia sp. MH4]|nr:hypothetical protein [Nocardia sp. MH4]